MQGNIDFTGSLSGSIAGGGGGGSDVTITPTLESGTKIADYTINDIPGVLYAPTPVSLTAQLPLLISENVISIDLSDYAKISDLGDYQEKLTAGNYISIDSNNEISCTPPITNVWYVPEPEFQQDILIGKFTVNDVTQNVYVPSGGGVNYSTSEQNTGIKWIDNKPLYQKTIHITEASEITNNTYTGLFNDADTIIIKDAIIRLGAIENNKWATVPYWANASYNLSCIILGKDLSILANGWKYIEAFITVLYTKSV